MCIQRKMISDEEYKKLFPNLTKAPQDLMAKWMESSSNEFDEDQYHEDPTKQWGEKVRVWKNSFPKHKEVTWNDIIPTLQAEYTNESIRFLTPGVEHVTQNEVEGIATKHPDVGAVVSRNRHGMFIPTMVTHTCEFLSDPVKECTLEAKEKMGINFLHIYTSILQESFIFGRHNDTMSVLIVAAINDIEYSFDDGSSYVLNPGDAIFIPRGVYHKPRVFGPRATFSYCWHYSR